MARLRPLPYREVVRKLLALGFVETSQKGSHVKFVKSFPGGTLVTVVPKHREVTAGSLRSILAQIHLSVDEFDSL